MRRVSALASAGVFLLAGCSLGVDEERGTRTTEPPEPPSAPGLTLRDDAEEFVQDLGEHASLGDPVELTVSMDKVGGSVRPENIGISLEATDLADPRLDPEASTLDERLNELGAPALRFGGNRLDRNLFWTSSGESPDDSDDVVVQPEDLERLRKLTDATDAKVTLGLPLGDFDPERGADMAAHAQQSLGDALVAVSIGNEPNGFTVEGEPNHRVRDDSWDVDAYVQQVEEYAAAVADAAPGLPIAGPGAFDAEWMRGFAGSDIADKAAVSQHWYALYDCESTEVPGRGPQAENFVHPEVHESAARILGIGLGVADEAGLPLWVEETGPTSCPGTNDTSRTQSKALWTIDYTLHAAQLGVQRMAMHSMLGDCLGGAPMSVICTAEDGPAAIVGQNNHAALRLASMSANGEFISIEGARSDVRTYAVHNEAADQIVVTVLSTADAADIDATPMSVDVPDGYAAIAASQVSAENLTEPMVSNYLEPLPLPANLPYSGELEDTADLQLDVDASSATVFVFERSAPATPTTSD
ncbi:hypothetical protein BJEO58_02456 [Brevibacterium jeotgali]|uniref:Glycosyl hydrolase family 79, N-terminal domain n=1 Tax=Brevibacterium jeotgali TaxID=1262550 RepID=A0A2H1L7G6_9MICO|nr:hypothetical protein [Brevibacterium jeotgali]TWC03419.1 hypothetical protein FB108_2147 [Brevibacterium jeotgali]SMY12848.1 hypothetical protein BJEO58_02456 [Brevibacterium jeotgali]